MALSVLLKSPVVLGSTAGVIAVGGTITVIALPKSIPYSYVVFEEETITANSTSFKCQLEKSQRVVLCNVSKITEAEGKDNKWIDYTRLKAIGTTVDGGAISRSESEQTTAEQKKKEFLFENNGIYKVKVAGDFIADWEKAQTTKLHIYPNEDHSEWGNPLTIALPKLALKNTNIFKGKSKFFIGKVQNTKITNETKDEPLTTANKWFKCDTPSSSAVNNNCEIYTFDAEDLNNKEWAAKKLNTPLIKASEVKKDLHYLIKFDEETTINASKYDQSATLKIKAFTDSSRTTAVTGSINEVVFYQLAHSVMFGKDEVNIDLALFL